MPALLASRDRTCPKRAIKPRVCNAGRALTKTHFNLLIASFARQANTCNRMARRNVSHVLLDRINSTPVRRHANFVRQGSFRPIPVRCRAIYVQLERTILY